MSRKLSRYLWRHPVARLQLINKQLETFIGITSFSRMRRMKKNKTNNAENIYRISLTWCIVVLRPFSVQSFIELFRELNLFSESIKYPVFNSNS